MTNNEFMRELQRQLTGRIKGKVSVHLTDGTIVIDINPPGRVPAYHDAIDVPKYKDYVNINPRVLSVVLFYHYETFIKDMYFYQ